MPKAKKPAKGPAASAPDLTPEQLRAWMEGNGVSQADLARSTGIIAMRLSRFLRGEGYLDAGEAELLAHFMLAGAASADGGPQPPSGAGGHLGMDPAEAQVLEVEAELSKGGDGEKDYLGQLARQNQGVLGKVLLQLASNPKTPAGVKLRAAEVLAERGWGKPGTVKPDTTPAAPVDDQQLLMKLTRMLAAERAKKAKPPEGGAGEGG